MAVPDATNKSQGHGHFIMSDMRIIVYLKHLMMIALFKTYKNSKEYSFNSSYKKI